MVPKMIKGHQEIRVYEEDEELVESVEEIQEVQEEELCYFHVTH
jgi:hypothetical protein